MSAYTEIFRLYHEKKVKINFPRLARELGISRQALHQSYKKFLAENSSIIVQNNMACISDFNSNVESVATFKELSEKLQNEVNYFFKEYKDYKALYLNLEAKQDAESFNKFEAKQKKFIYESKFFAEILKMFHLLQH